MPKTLISSCAFRGCFLARRKLLAFDFSQTQSYLNSSKLPQRRKLLNGSLPNKTVGAFSFLTLLISFHISGNGIILSHCEAVIPKGGSHKTKSMLDSGRKGITSRQSALYNVMSFAKQSFPLHQSECLFIPWYNPNRLVCTKNSFSVLFPDVDGMEVKL